MGEFGGGENGEVMVVWGKIEWEIGEVEGEEKGMLVEEVGIEEWGVDEVIKGW